MRNTDTLIGQSDCSYRGLLLSMMAMGSWDEAKLDAANRQSKRPRHAALQEPWRCKREQESLIEHGVCAVTTIQNY